MLPMFVSPLAFGEIQTFESVNFADVSLYM